MKRVAAIANTTTAAKERLRPTRASGLWFAGPQLTTSEAWMGTIGEVPGGVLVTPRGSAKACSVTTKSRELSNRFAGSISRQRRIACSNLGLRSGTWTRGEGGRCLEIE